MLPIALDAMGGDFAPSEVIAGARLAKEELGLEIILVGDPARLGDTSGFEVFACTEVIEMDDDAGTSVRKKKDSSLVRAAELVRDGKASAMVSAGNTGATMASALLRMGRLPGVIRPCINTPIPNPGKTPAAFMDAGANAECTPEMLVQFAQMGAAYVRSLYGVTSPRVGLLSIGEESSKGTPLVKETHELLRAAMPEEFFGNVEGRDLIPSPVDVIVTDGFTGNVALKTLEGSMKFVFDAMVRAVGTNDETMAAGATLAPYMAEAINAFTVENHGGAMLLGVNGICIISHGASNSVAIKNALRVANEMVTAGVVESLRTAIRPE